MQDNSIQPTTRRGGEMARPIEATPALTGKGAAEFITAAMNPKPYTPPTFNTQKMHEAVRKIAAARAQK
ncbi:hypothetical protein DGI_2065 [Megalodesulfovibrio gigas DSM 1382 = ATCC 19364]|uniref:Uncharacterized protein n=2 Tax=Megalodesulfovibrio gigas TaxID=879 RepID=T2GCC6_MEGG1|nr:hypothetical protein DGI_2065 [Megalodesulfovibrio gigas DSM 1382 = ATCC 19364]